MIDASCASLGAESVALQILDEIKAQIDRAPPAERGELLTRGLERLTGKRYTYKPSVFGTSPPLTLNESDPEDDAEPLWTATQPHTKHAEMLAHELRTPMQGIVGTLDLMHHSLHLATEAAQQLDANNLQTLDRDIQAVQESARRAVDVADNIVRAYEMNMGRATIARPQQPAEAISAKRPSLKRKRTDSGFSKDDRPMTQPKPLPVANVRELLEQTVNDAIYTSSSSSCLVSRIRCFEYGESLKINMSTNDGTAITNTLNWSVSQDVPTCIFVNASSLAKATACLLQNALKFTRGGSIRLKATLHDGALCVTITDTGPGISPNFRSELFKAFSREESGSARKSEGLGLGLLVARGLIQKMGGSLTLLSADVEGPNRGSTFELSIPIGSSSHHILTAPLPTPPETAHLSDLPPTTSPLGAFTLTPMASPSAISTTTELDYAEHAFPFARQLHYWTEATGPGATEVAQDVNADAATVEVESAPAKRKKTIDPELALRHPLRILVAEDNAINRRLLVGCLTKMGYHDTVVEAVDGSEAIQQFKMSTTPFDLVLMDLWMPKTDGYEACSEILCRCAEESQRSPTIIAVTADSTEYASEKTTAAGMKGTLLKPYVLKALEKLLITVSETRRARE